MQNYWPEKYRTLDFVLPEAQIATTPVQPADHARLMVIDRAKQTIAHHQFFNLPDYLTSGDAIFYNATQVEARRVFLTQRGMEKRYECVFLRRSVMPPLSDGMTETWQVLMRGIRSLKDGVSLVAANDPSLEFQLHRAETELLVSVNRRLAAEEFFRIGEMPIPPYMQRTAQEHDNETYQNFFRNQISEPEKIRGSAASPTAALHFTPELFAQMKASGIEFHPVCLDIGYGTFAPLSEDNFSTKKLHAEHFYIPTRTTARLQGQEKKIALGTTSLRAILSHAHYGVSEGETDIFIEPGDAISGLDGLITNFHLPQSSLILLTAAFCGADLLLRAYREAIDKGYRFYSYGDAMLIL